MLAKIAGLLLLAAGIVLGIKSLGAMVLGFVGIIGMTLLVGVVGLALLVGWRLLNSATTLGKVAGAFVLVAGAVGAVPAAMSVVAGTIAAVLLALKIVVVVLLLYVGWGWFQSGSFGLSRCGRLRGGGW